MGSFFKIGSLFIENGFTFFAKNGFNFNEWVHFYSLPMRTYIINPFTIDDIDAIVSVGMA